MVITWAFHEKEQAQFVKDRLEERGISLVFIELQIPDAEVMTTSELRHRKKEVINKMTICGPPSIPRHQQYNKYCGSKVI